MHRELPAILQCYNPSILKSCNPIFNHSTLQSFNPSLYALGDTPMISLNTLEK